MRLPGGTELVRVGDYTLQFGFLILVLINIDDESGVFCVGTQGRDILAEDGSVPEGRESKLLVTRLDGSEKCDQSGTEGNDVKSRQEYSEEEDEVAMCAVNIAFVPVSRTRGKRAARFVSETFQLFSQ